MSAAAPHDREAAVRSVCGPSAQLGDYELKLASIRVYGSQVGVVHYSYSASIVADGMPPRRVTGRWTEVYLGDDAGWKMICVSGLPDPPISASRAAREAP
jgi:hypothetical protein